MSPAVTVMTEVDNVVGEAHLENHDESGESKNVREAEIIHDSAEDNADRFAEVGHDMFDGVIAELVAVVDEINIVAITDVLIGSRD